MKALIFSFFFLFINQSVLATEESDCRFDRTNVQEYRKIQRMVRDNIIKAIDLWLKEKEILIKEGPFERYFAYSFITQKFDDDYYPKLYLRPIFSLITNKDQKLQSSWVLNDSDYNSPEYKIQYLSLIIRDNQGIPLKKVCKIFARENIILEILNVTQNVKLDEIVLYKNGDIVYQFEDDYSGVSSPVELEEGE